jgi:hypothetical protein|tara:strand:- start:1204 stop:1572 length:369 start_codon:yes stop_codon:yes gene_type:complete
MNDKIKQKVLARNWSFNEIANLNQTIESLATDTYEEMKLIERFELIREIRIKETYVGEVFEDVMKQTVLIALRAEVANTVRNMLNNATVNFGGNKNDEVSERSVVGESNEERSSTTKKNSKK